jgi:hypothetical protein
VFYTERTTRQTNSPQDTDLFAAVASTGEIEQLTHDDGDTWLLDASGTALLYADHSGSDWGEPWRLVYQSAGASPRELGKYTLIWTGYGDPYTAMQRKLLDGGGATWAAEDAIYYFDGSEVHRVAQAKYPTPPHLAGRTLVWSSFDGEDHEVFRYREGRTERLTDNTTSDLGPVLVGEEVVWLCDQSICRFADGRTEILEQGPCTPPAASGTSAAWSCAHHISRYTPGRSPSVVAERQAAVSGVRLEGDLMAWVEVPDPTSRPGLEHGTLVFHDGAKVIEVATVDLPCIYCNAYWPPLQLSLSGDVLAWSYAHQPGRPSFEGTPYGYVRIIPEERCP